MSSYFLPQWPNHSVNRTAEKLRFSVPRRLRRRAAGYLKLQGLPKIVQVF